MTDDARTAMEAWLNEDCPHRPEWLAPNDAWKRHACMFGQLNNKCLADLFARLEEAEHDGVEQARLAGMGSEREASLMGKVSRLEAENAQLREALEKIRFDAGSHTMAIGDARRQETSGFGYIYQLADAALAGTGDSDA